MDSRSLRIRLGLFVALAAILFAAMILLFGSLPTFFKRTTSYTVRFTDAPGLGVGAPVRRSGVRVGAVRFIELDEDRGVVRVTIAVDAPYSLRKSEQPTLVNGLLGSDASIDFIPRSAIEDREPIDRSVVEPGTELVGIRATTVNALLKGAADVVPTTQETLNEIRKSMAQVEKLASRVEKAVPVAEDTMREYRELAKRAQKSVPELEKTNAKAQEVIRSVQDILPEVQRAAEEYRLLGRDARAALSSGLKTFEKTADEYTALAKDVRTALPELRATNKEVNEFVKSARAALPTFERTADEIRELAGDVRKLAPAANRAIEDYASLAREAKSLVEDVNVFWKANRGSAEEILTNLNTSVKQVNKLLSDENVRKIDATLTNVRTASDDFPRIAKNLNEVTDASRTTIKSLNDVLDNVRPLVKELNDVTIKDFNRVLKQIESTLVDIQKVTRPLGESSPRLIKNTDESIDKINRILGDVRALLASVDKADGLLKKVLTDPAVYNNIDQATMAIVKIMPRLDRILKDFEVFADKVARHPESIGIGGAVRPGSGLKNPPTPPIGTYPR